MAEAVTTVAVLGAGGTMGGAMARNLLAAGMAVRAWNRTSGRTEDLAERGATMAGTPADAAAGADVLLTMLSDAGAVTAVVEGPGGALAGLGGGAVWVQAGTIGEEGTARCAALAAAAGIGFVDAPVLGTRGPADEGALVVLASGPDALRERVRPVLDAIGSRTMWVGEAGAGTRLKLVTNAWILAVVEGAAEALALAEGLGLEPALLLEAVAGGPLDMAYLRVKGGAMIAREFPVDFRLGLAAKDAALVVSAAAGRGLDLPLLETIRERLARGAERHGEQDLSATFLTSAPEG
jgi:3-hydroxyisobutyrate dehydrogenase